MAEVTAGDAGDSQRKARNEDKRLAGNGESSRNGAEKSENAKAKIVKNGKESPVQSSSHDGEKSGDAGEGEDAKPKDSFVRKIVDKIGLDVGTVMMMFK